MWFLSGKKSDNQSEEGDKESEITQIGKVEAEGEKKKEKWRRARWQRRERRNVRVREE